jgi:hypothetical protein
MTFNFFLDLITQLYGLYNTLVTFFTYELLPGVTVWMVMGGVGLITILLINIARGA